MSEAQNAPARGRLGLTGETTGTEAVLAVRRVAARAVRSGLWTWRFLLHVFEMELRSPSA